MNIRGWIRARVVLGVALALHLLRWPLRKRGASARWLRQIARENLGRTPAGNWRSNIAASRCIQCGLCSALAPESLVRFDHLIAGPSRRAEDAPWGERYAPILRAHASHLRLICPVGVDANAVADLLEQNVAVLREATAENTRVD